MAEVAPASGGGPNRLFVVIALGLVGLLILGVIAIGGIFVLNQFARPAVAPTPTIRIAVTTPTRVLPTSTVAAAPTETSAATATRVFDVGAPVSGGGTPAAAVTVTTAVTGTVAPGTGTPGSGQLPDTGVGEDLLLLAAGIVLVLVIFAARRARGTAKA